MSEVTNLKGDNLYFIDCKRDRCKIERYWWMRKNYLHGVFTFKKVGSAYASATFCCCL